MHTAELIRALRQVPQARLRLIEPAREVVREDGTLDSERLAFFSKELLEAIDEARAYARATKETVQCLKTLARS